MWVKLLKNVANAIKANRPASASRATTRAYPRPPSSVRALRGPAKLQAPSIFSYKLEFRLGPKLDRQFDYGAAKKERSEQLAARQLQMLSQLSKKKKYTYIYKTRMRALGTKRNAMKRMRPYKTKQTSHKPCAQ